jgi:hypothetical protein
MSNATLKSVLEHAETREPTQGGVVVVEEQTF